jgi:hypothetical protein
MTTTIEQLKSVLCDPEGKCCIAGSDADRAIVDAALTELEALVAERDALAAELERVKGQEPTAHLWQHSGTGRTRIVMPGQIITADADWVVVGPLYLGAAPPAQPASMGPKLQEFFAELEYNAPDWDVFVCVYRRRNEDAPELVHREQLPQQITTAQLMQEPVARIVSSGPENFPLLEWISADHSFRAPIGSMLCVATPPAQPAPSGYKLVPEEPTPEIIASAAIAVWPTASKEDIELARKAAPIVLMKYNLAPELTAEMLANVLATMAPAYRAMIAAAPLAPAEAK